MKHIFATIVLLASAVTTAYAQFGSGIVYDPTQGAHAIQQIQQFEQQIQKAEQQIQKAEQIYTTALSRFCSTKASARSWATPTRPGGTSGTGSCAVTTAFNSMQRACVPASKWSPTSSARSLTKTTRCSMHSFPMAAV